jgi:hypothetical protein
MFSNEPIKPYLDDPIKFANVRNVLLEEKIATVILQKFKHRLDIKPTNPAPNNPDATKTATDKNKIN